MYDLNKSGTITKDEFKDILQEEAEIFHSTKTFQNGGTSAQIPQW
ncbi:unnamed protein product [Nippostrongylus brasiliensis]|uniref:EF-hand domain-containing protein n=1 Tax=Nippostrongylus brasiliensis TaxID=27835 RepID=A0A0N4YZV6_NIPBR|nr:unnamed protein product [Nippostrongylus brasiliensis]